MIGSIRPLSMGMGALLVVSAALAQTPTAPPAETPQHPAPIATGVVPLPPGPPSTKVQGPVPRPTYKLPAGDRPLLWSPNLDQLNGFVGKEPITMNQAVAIALYTSKPFASAVANLVEVGARAGIARSALLPTIGVDENLTYFDKQTTVNFAAFSGGSTSTNSSSTTPPLVVTPQFNPVFTAALNLPFDLFGTLHSAVSQAKFNEVAARIDVNKVRNQTVYDVKNAFYAVLRASAQVAVAQDTLNSSLLRLDDANKNYGAGTVSRFDITTAQRDVADAQQSLITAQGQVAINLSNLKNVMGLNLAGRLSIKNDGAVDYPEGVTLPGAPDAASAAKASSIPPEAQNPEDPHTVPSIPLEGLDPSGGRSAPALDPTKPIVVSDNFDFGPDYNSLLEEAFRYRPEILEAEAQITAGKKGLQYALRSTLPSFKFAVEDIYTANSTPLERKNQEALVLDISVPIFDGGLARETAREQHAIIAQAEINRRNAQGQVQSDVQQAYIALVQARQRTQVANVEVATAKEAFRVSQVRYRAGVSGQVGVSPQLELSNAQTTLAQAESNLVNAVYDYNTARAQLDRAAGRYGFTGSGPGYPSVTKIPR